MCPAAMRCFVLLTLVLAGAAPALACIVAYGAYHPSLWHRLTDFRAPSAPEVLAGPIDLRRGTFRSPDENGVVYTTSCDDIGLFRVVVSPSRDNRTSPYRMGYEIEVVAGSMPEHGRWDAVFGAPLPRSNGVSTRTLMETQPESLVLPFSWVDGSEERQEPIDVAFVLRAVDRAGRRSAPSDTIRVSDPGR